jgi:hypothetical protein
MRNAFRCFTIVLMACWLSQLPAGAQGKKGGGAAASPAASTASTASNQGSGSTAAFESQMLAYGGLDHIAAALAGTVCTTPGVNKKESVILIYDQTAFTSLQSYEAFLANIQMLIGSYGTLIPDVASVLQSILHTNAQNADQAAQAAATAGDKDKQRLSEHQRDHLNTMAATFGPTDPGSDFNGLLSSIAIASNTENPGQITIPDSAMALALTGELKKNCGAHPTLVYPPLFGKGSSSDYASSDIQDYIKALNDIRKEAQKQVDTGTTTFMATAIQRTHIDAATTPIPTTTPTKQNVVTDQTVSGANTQVTDAVAAFTDINGLYDGFMNSLLQVNSSSGVIGSASVVQGNQLAGLLRGTVCPDLAKKDADARKSGAPAKQPATCTPQNPAFVLLASVTSAGGTERVHKNIWTALWSGDKITYSGGAIVNVGMWQANSTPILSTVLRYRVPFTNVAAPGNLDGTASGDNLGTLPKQE